MWGKEVSPTGIPACSGQEEQQGKDYTILPDLPAHILFAEGVRSLLSPGKVLIAGWAQACYCYERFPAEVQARRVSGQWTEPAVSAVRW